jgi:myo-inositol-1-phosphate synthase
MEAEKQMDLILGIGPEHQFADGLTKKIRVGTVKQLKDVGELYKDKLKRPKFAIYNDDEEQITKWVEILNIICIEGFSREEFDNSIPEQMESAVDRFLFD